MKYAFANYRFNQAVIVHGSELDRNEESRGLTVAFSAWRFRVTRTQKTIYFPFRPED